MCYKNEKNLFDTINTILEQTYTFFEIIISDDCSPNIDKRIFDSISNLLEQKGVKFTINYNLKNLGTVRHFNKLINEASGDIIVPLSCGDCFYDNQVLENVVKYFNKYNCMIVTGKREAIIDGQIKIYPNKHQINVIKDKNKKIINYMARYYDLISGSCTYYSRDVFNKFGMFDEQYTLLEDCPYYIHYLANNGKIMFIDRILIKYEMNGVSTGAMHPLLKEDFSKLFYNIKERYMDNLTNMSKRVVDYRIYNLSNSFFSKIKYFDIIVMLVYNRLKNR